MFLLLVGIDWVGLAILLGLILLIGLTMLRLSRHLFKTLLANSSLRSIGVLSWLTTLVLTPLTVVVIIYGLMYFLSPR